MKAEPSSPLPSIGVNAGHADFTCISLVTAKKTRSGFVVGFFRSLQLLKMLFSLGRQIKEIHPDNAFHPRVGPRARPTPISRLFRQTLAHRILMNVVQGFLRIPAAFA
jgi:hypothetical protein